MKKGIDYIAIGVVTLCHDGQGNYLLGKRSEQCRDERLRWDLIGSGGVEFGERLDTALRREVREETGSEVKEFKYLGFREVLRGQGEASSHWIAFDFKVEVDRFTVKNCEPEKCLELGWFRLEDFPAPMHSQWPVFYEQYRDLL